jgi:uncharacterized repeat protein (TIGR02543 family)
VINVNWYDAIGYCNWLSEQEELLPAYDSSGNLLNTAGQITTDITKVEGYRLPTSAEWEYAARGGHEDIIDGIEANDFKYAGGNNIDDVGWNAGNRIKDRTQPVGKKEPNELGLYDMSGNVWEFCHDYAFDYTYTVEDQINPVGPDSTDGRVVRGGGWQTHPSKCRVAIFSGSEPLDNYVWLGFRIARTREVIPAETYTLTIEASLTEGGDVSFDNTTWNASTSQTVAEGTSISIYAATETDYVFDGWYENGIQISIANPHSVTVEEGRTIEARFSLTETELIHNDVNEQGKYKLTLNKLLTDGGTVTGVGYYETGAEVDIQAKTNTGYWFVNWTKEGAAVSTQANYTYTMPSENVTLVANFVPIIETVLVNRGSFQMGNTRGDSEGYDDEKPVHTVTLTYDYYIGQYEVTFDEYDAYCKATGESKPKDEGWGRGNRPVINVTWWDGISYCNWLSEQAGLPKAYDNSGNLLDKNGRQTTDITQVEGYRLPTEAEWEYAARGGQKSTSDYKYAGSNNIDEVAWYRNNSTGKTQEVGQKSPNELGIYDMSGNVWEWCHDWYASYSNTTQTNPIGPNSDSVRIGSGGSWGNRARDCRVAHRNGRAPSGIFDFIGLRVVRTRE